MPIGIFNHIPVESIETLKICIFVRCTALNSNSVSTLAECTTT